MSTPCLTSARPRTYTSEGVLSNNCASDVETSSTNSQPLPKWLIQNRQCGWRRATQNFTPAWFSMIMGTGIVSILLHSFSTLCPDYHRSLETLAIVFFILNVALFSIILLVSVLRYTLFPATWSLMINHPAQSLFLGTLPMGFATIINMFTLVCVPRWGGATPQIAWGMWWIDAAVSVACCFGLPFQMMTKHKTRHNTMTAAWLLPVVAPIVAAASGAVVASALPNPQHALWTIITSYVLWGMGVPLALVIMVIYFHRLAVYKLPPHEVIVSVFLPLGPMGQGGYGIMQLGSMSMKLFPHTYTLRPAAGEILYVLGFGVAIIMWGFGLVWLFFAIASIMSRKKFPFNMSWWGFTFPIGVYAMCTLTMGEELPSSFFRIMGMVLGISVMLLWLIVAIGTIKNISEGNLFEAPCLREMERACRTAAEKERQEV